MCKKESLWYELEQERKKLHLLLAQTERPDTEKWKDEILEQSRKIDAILEQMLDQPPKTSAGL